MSSLWNSSFVYPCCSLRGVHDLALGCGWQISAFPSASFSSLCLGHSGVLTFLWLFEPKERIGCSARFLGIIFLCVATLCKIARSRVLLTCTWTAGSLCSDLQAYSSPTNATSTLPQHKGQCMTSDQRTTSGFPSNFLPEMGDQIIFWFTHISHYFLLNIWNENSIIWCLGFFASFVWLAVHWEKV